MFDVKATDFTDRRLVGFEEASELLLEETLERMYEELNIGIEVVQMESVRIGSILGAVEAFMMLGKLQSEIIQLGRAYVIRKVTTRIEDIQGLSANLEHIAMHATIMWESVGKTMPEEDEQCVSYALQILDSLIYDFGEVCEQDTMPEVRKCEPPECRVIPVEDGTPEA